MNRIWDPRMNLDFEQCKTCKQLFHVALLGMARRDSASSGLKTSRAVLQPIPQRARTEPRNGTQEISFGPRTATQNSAQESIQESIRFLFRSPEMLREICARILIHEFLEGKRIEKIVDQNSGANFTQHFGGPEQKLDRFLGRILGRISGAERNLLGPFSGAPRGPCSGSCRWAKGCLQGNGAIYGIPLRVP